jgi:restriction system protein
MAVPKFQECMLPALELMSDLKQRGHRQIIEQVADAMNISQIDRDEMVPSGVEPRYANRISWATYYLKRAGLLKTIKRGVYVVTDNGLGVIKQKPECINTKFLMKFEEFQEFHSKSNKGTDKTENNEVESDNSAPDELIDKAWNDLQETLVADLKDELHRVTPAKFEYIVVNLLEKMGYGGFREGAGKVTGGPSDQGIDGIIDQDRLGLDKVYIQAKRWKGTVRSKDIQGFVGALVKHNSEKGVFITTNNYTKDAIGFAQNIGKNISLIDGDTLARLMIEHDLGVIVERTLKIKKIDENYFPEELME